MKVIVTERIADDGLDILRQNGYEVDAKFGISREELLDIIDEYDAIIVRSVTKINEELLSKATNLKVVGRAGNGIDNIELPQCTKKGIIVVNTPESNIMAAAELAVGHTFAIFRNIPQADIGAKVKSDFRRNRFIGNELDGKVAGIIGLGRIGSIVASKLRGCNMKVCAYDPYITDEKYAKLGVEKCKSLEELLKKADLITLHTPKTAETYGMIGEKELSICKDGVRIVNAARGGLVNEKALYDALVSGKVRAAAIDVFDKEPNYDKNPEDQDYTNPLLTLDNVVVSPHLGASTEEANYNVGVCVAKLVCDALNGEIVAAVNMPPMKVKDLHEIKPYINLAEILGKIYYQTESNTVDKIEVLYSGDLADMETSVFSLSVLKGFLSQMSPEKVNYVNAGMIVESMGIKFIESKTSELDKYTNLITVTFVAGEKRLSVSGTVFAKEEIRIVDFYGYKLDFEPTENVIAIQNVDKPGIIGKIGTTLGENNINISAMQWGARKDKAISFLSVDSEISKEIADQLRNIDGVLKVSTVKF